MLKRTIYIVVTILFSFCIFVAPVEAASATFNLSPNKGVVKTGSKFSVDMMIDTNGTEVILARAVLTFDPSILEVVKAENNVSLFCSYPEDKQSIDNTNGVIVLMGFCQSGVGTPYKTTGDPDVFGRIQFLVKKSGKINIDWEYSGEDQEFKSAIVQDGSPASNILSSAPISAKFTTSSGGGNNGGNTPGTGFFISWSMIVFGIIFVILGVLYTYLSLKRGYNGKLKTVILNE